MTTPLGNNNPPETNLRAPFPGNRRTDALERTLPVALIWVTAAFLVHELCSLDVWWHLVIGRDILQTLQVPAVNAYSAAALGQPYHDSHWLFQLVLALFHLLAGLNGPILFMVLIWAATLSIVYREVYPYSGAALAVFITFLVMGASAERFLPRPEIVTFLMIALFYRLLRQGRYQTPPQMALFLLLQVIWVNSHGLFVIGPFMVGCYWLAQLIARIRGQANRLRPLSVLLALTGLCLLVSPYGVGALEYSLLLFREVGREAPDYMQAVTELSPTFGAAAMQGSAFWFFAGLMLLTLAAILCNPAAIALPRLLIVIGLGLAALTGRRNIVLFALVAAPFLAEQFAGRWARFSPAPALATSAKGALLALLLAWSAYPLSGAYYLDMELPARSGLGVTPDFFPHELPAFIRRHNIQGQVYNTSRLGGFYLYHLYPERIPFIDGRWEIYGAPFFAARQTALQHFPAWRQWIRQYDIQSVLLHHTAPEAGMLAPALYRDPGWSLVYYDFAASYFVRNSALGSAKPIVFNADSPLPAGRVRPDSRFILSAFYRNMGLKSLLIANLEQLLPSGLHRREVLFEIAKNSLELNRIEQAENYYQQLLTYDGAHTEALSDLSFIYYQRQQFTRSLQYAERALRSAPDNLDVRFNRCLVLVALNRRQEAREELERILRIQPGYTKAKYLQQQIR